MQTDDSMDATAFTAAKLELRKRLDELRTELDRYLADQYGVNTQSAEAYATWRISHQPFHWLVEFYGITHGGGFDVIIGNPPYVEYRHVKNTYSLLGGYYSSEKVANLYAFCMERCCHLGSVYGRFGMIVPAGIMGLDDARPARRVLLRSYRSMYCSTYAIRPSKLFDGVDQRLCILIAQAKEEIAGNEIWTTRYHHWTSAERPYLMANLSYRATTVHSRLDRIPQLGGRLAAEVFAKIERASNRVIGDCYTRSGRGFLIHYHRSPRYWIRAMDFEQYFRSKTRSRSVHHFRDLRFRNKKEGKCIGAILNSSLFFFWFVAVGNGRNITGRDVEKFPVGVVAGSVLNRICRAFDQLMSSYRENSFVRVRKDCEFQEFRPSLSKKYIDEIDVLLSEHYSFTREQLDFVVNYEIKYRMGKDSSEES